MHQKRLHFLQFFFMYFKGPPVKKKKTKTKPKHINSQFCHYVCDCFCSSVAAVYADCSISGHKGDISAFIFDFVPIFTSLQILNDSIGQANDDDENKRRRRPPPSSSSYSLNTSRCNITGHH